MAEGEHVEDGLARRVEWAVMVEIRVHEVDPGGVLLLGPDVGKTPDGHPLEEGHHSPHCNKGAA